MSNDEIASLMKQATLLIPSSEVEGDDTKHLYIILTNPHSNIFFPEEHCLIVNITSIRKDVMFDESCILTVGEHPFIRHDSYVLYARSRLEKTADLEDLIQQKKLKKKENLTFEVFERVCKGLIESDHVKPAHVSFFESANG